MQSKPFPDFAVFRYQPLKGDTMHFQINYLSVAGKHSGLEEVQATAGRHKLVLDVILIVRIERI